jgi:NADPH:quinone reductase-like Zn-dependent oxidoreductase
MSTNLNTAWRRVESGKGARGLKRSQEPIPTPLPHQYLVRIHAVSLNYRDVAMVNGAYPFPLKEKGVLGGDMSAEIVKAGECATKFAVGERVTAIFNTTHLYGIMTEDGELYPILAHFQHAHTYMLVATLGGPLDGTLQEYRVFDETTLLRAPDYLTYDEIACFPIAGATAWNALFGGGNPLGPGQTALFQGTGGVSIFGLQIAHAAGARVRLHSPLGAVRGYN